MQHSSTPWWRTDHYEVEAGVPHQFDYDWCGPKGLALVRAWPSGVTDRGWGLNPPKGETEGFMPRYMRGEFNERRVVYGHDRGHWAFAYIMRSVRLVCIDIDGKNGGLTHAKELGPLPPTMAETSKSGDGFHLFYLVDEEWDDVKGYALLADRIGIEQGVDIRATGCVYHHAQQRWNRRPVAQLPGFLLELLQQREQKQAATSARIEAVLENNDDLEVLMLQDEILSDLKKPIAMGKRNVTLFAIGNQMRQAQIPDWEEVLRDRAAQVGLPDDESDKLVENVGRYGVDDAVAVTP